MNCCIACEVEEVESPLRMFMTMIRKMGYHVKPVSVVKLKSFTKNVFHENRSYLKWFLIPNIPKASLLNFWKFEVS